MIESIVISEDVRLSTCIIRRVNINQFDLSTKLLFEGMECDEVVALDDEILAEDAFFVALEFANFAF